MGTVIAGAAVLAAAAFAVRSLIPKKEENASSCGCGCSGCPHSGSCGK